MKKFDWEKFNEEKIVVKFSSKEEIIDFLDNAFIRGFEFYNKRSKKEDLIYEWDRHRYIGLIAKNKKLIRTFKEESDEFIELIFWEYYMPKRKKKIATEKII